jgi:fibronectin type 3 domain-containing protein
MASTNVWKRWAQRLLRGGGIGLFLAVFSLVTGAASAEAATLSGTFKDGLGNPIPSAVVQLINSSGQVAGQGSTASDGTYAFTVAAGNYSLAFALNTTASSIPTAPPGNFHGQTSGFGPFVNMSNGDVTKDFALDSAPVTVTVLDSFGMPLANAAIGASDIVGQITTAGMTFNTGMQAPLNTSLLSVRTDILGNATIYLPKGISYSKVTAYPSVGYSMVYTSLGTVTGSRSITLQQPPSHMISGIFRDALGAPVSNAQLTLLTTANSAISTLTTANDGVFTFTAPGGTYNIGVKTDRHLSPGSAVPSGVYVSPSSLPLATINLASADISRDLQIDSVPVTVKLIDYGGNPIVGKGITAQSSSGEVSENPLSTYYNVGPLTDADGAATLYLPKLRYSTFRANITSSVSTAVFAPNTVLAAPLSYLIRYNSGSGSALLSGTVTAGQTNTAMAGVTVDIINPTNGNVANTTTTSASGTYSTFALPGTYNIRFTPPAGSGYQTKTVTGFVLNFNKTLNTSLTNVSALIGIVKNGANLPLANTLVQVVAPTNHANVLGSAITNSSGVYSLVVPFGTYDVIFTPSSSTYESTIKTNINLTVDNTVDVVLVLASRTFSGTLKDRNNVAISGAMLSLHNQGGQTVTATAGADGTFSVQANPATYSLTIIGSQAAAPLALVPANFTLSGGSLDLTSDISQDLVVNAVTATFTTKNAVTGAAVDNVALSIGSSAQTTLYAGSGNYSGSFSGTVTTNGSGVASVVMLTGSTYTVNATPPAGSGVLATSFPTAGPLTSDTAVDLPLTSDVHVLGGVLKDQSGVGIAAANVSLNGTAGHFSTTTIGDGTYSVTAAPGTYTLSVTGTKGSNAALMPDSFSANGQSVDLVSGDFQQDLTLDSSMRTITALSPTGELLTGMNVSLICSGTTSLFNGANFNGSSTSSGVTNANGTVDLVKVTSYEGCTTTVTAPSGSGYDGSTCTGSSTEIICSRVMRAYSGAVTDRNGLAVANATVHVDGNQPDMHYAAVTNAFGEFSLQVAAFAGYQLHVTGTSAGAAAAIVPDNYSLSAATDVTSDKTQDIVVDTVDVAVTARDDRLTPVPNLAIVFGSAGLYNGFSASSSNIARTTDAGGHAQLVMLKGTTYTISATPAASTGYINTTFNGTSPIVFDTEVIIEFQNHIPLAPTNLTAVTPTKDKPVLSWTAVAGVDHYQVYRDNVAVGTTTDTAFTDAALADDDSYAYRVTAVSSDNYESPKSNTATVSYDTTAPVLGDPAFSVNPKVVSQSSELSATVSDAGVGVAGGEYFIGTTDPGQGSGTTLTLANGTLTTSVGTDLPAGIYVYNVRAKDALGTWSGLKVVTLNVSRPDAPTDLVAASPTKNDPALSWTASAGADHYNVYRDGVKIGESVSATYTDAGLLDGTYSYAVSAVNGFGDESDQSSAITVVADRTAPGITYVLSAAPNANGWNKTDVTVTFVCADGLSGVATCTDPVTVSEGANQTVTGTAVDAAGNSASTSVVLNVDKTLPTVTYSLSSTPNAQGWYSDDATVTFACADTLSGVAGCTQPIAVHEGANQVVSGTVTDQAGNTASVTTAPLSVDKTAPAISYSLSQTPTNDAWNNTSATVTFSCSDGLSGVQSCSAPVTFTSQGGDQEVTGTAVDKAGNTTVVTVVVSIDTTDPTVSNLHLSSRMVRAGGSLTITADAADVMSGVVGGEYYIDTDPGEGSGSSMAYAGGQLTATTTVNGLSNGAHRVYVRARDAAGNWSNVLWMTFAFVN